jgi:hypothetical protein
MRIAVVGKGNIGGTPGTNLLFADPKARAAAEELIRAVGLEPAYLGDASATAPGCQCGSRWSSRTAGTAGWR